MIEITALEALSYIANVIFVTWGITSILKDKSHNKHIANFFNSAYEMSDRLYKTSPKVSKTRAEALNIRSFLIAATRNFMGRKLDVVGGENPNIFIRIVRTLCKTGGRR